MEITIYRGNKEIGGTLFELKSSGSRILIDAGYPLFLNNEPIPDAVAKKPCLELLALGVLPDVKGLYAWDEKSFDAVIISHAHLDHYGLLKYINPEIPIYLSRGTETLIRISQTFKLYEQFELYPRHFNMYEQFEINAFKITPYLMDHSAFDAAAFEISGNDKTVIYTGDFRGHGRKAICLDRFIAKAKKSADALLVEGTMFGRLNETVLAEHEIEEQLIKRIQNFEGPVLFQSSSQNIDRLVTFYRVALKLNKLFIIDVYTANVLHELRKLGNNQLPYPSKEYGNIKVFFPYRLTQKIFKEIDEDYAKRFSPYYISKDKLRESQNNIVMSCRPSMKRDIELAGLHSGLFIYSLWSGYRASDYQKAFEDSLKSAGFSDQVAHTSGHATVADIQKVIGSLNARRVIPIHTLNPDSFIDISENVELKEDGISFKI